MDNSVKEVVNYVYKNGSIITEADRREVLDSIDGEMVRKALARIPEDQRRTIELAFFGGYTHREIAQKEDIPLGTVKSRIRVGMDKLRELLKELASRHMAE